LTGLELKDGSHEGYFAVTILARLLGSPLGSSSVVTGSIGEQREDEYGKIADFEFKWPAGVARKLRYSFSTGLFERVAIPLPPDAKGRAELESELSLSDVARSADVNYCSTLQTVADALLGSDWRQQWFVRCPEVAEAAVRAKDAWEEQPAYRDRAIKCQEFLASNADWPVLSVRGFKATDLARAFWYINKLRYELPEGRTPPMISTAFIRVIDSEQDSRFWNLIWRMIGAPWEDFESLIASRTEDEAVGIIADALNRFEPEDAAPRFRAPDVIVLVGTRRFIDSLERTRNRRARSLPFDRIMRKLGQEGVLRSGIRNQAMRDLMGRARIILISEDHYDPERPKVLKDENLDDSERKVLRRLSVFRFGFTYQMARRVLMPLDPSRPLDGDDVREIPLRTMLANLVQKGALGRALGQWYVRTRTQVQDAQRVSDDSLDALESHGNALIALCPYLWPHSDAAIAGDRAFHPEYVREAQWHSRSLHAAFLAAGDGLSPELRTVCKNLGRHFLKLHLFADYRSVGTLNSLRAVRNATIAFRDIAKECVARAERAARGGFAHPSVYQLAGDVIRRYVDVVKHPWFRKKKTRDKVSAEILEAEVLEFYGRAEAACGRPDLAKDKDYNLLATWSRKAVFLGQHGSPSHGRRTVDELIERCLKLRPKFGDDHSAAPGEFYELCGDRRQNHFQAAGLYELGVSEESEWAQLPIKYLGACVRASHPASRRVQNALAIIERMDSSPQELLDRARGACERELQSSRGLPPWVRERWQAALTVFAERYDVASALESYASLRFDLSGGPRTRAEGRASGLGEADQPRTIGATLLPSAAHCRDAERIAVDAPAEPAVEQS
jgi:hypothetical protein